MGEYEDILMYDGGMSDGDEMYKLDDNELEDAGGRSKKMSKHTKEPWRVELVDMENDEKICIASDAFDIVSPHVPRAIRKIEDAERIVQCVNACAPFKDPAREIAQLRADRAVLFDAYKELVYECLNDFVHIPEHRKTAEEYYSEELALIKRMEAWE